MKNLIMADLKVLGNRLWAVPLGALVLTIITALVLGGNHDGIMFIDTAIIPVIFVLLSYSLMYYSENSKLHNEIGSLPCSSLTIVSEYDTCKLSNADHCGTYSLVCI
ncbi:MAG: ABC-2 transporter permease [Candidatus Delongbacteria bacterium]|nr:ABC-2 transporter permease [Candidatus Delongbacteria bacterium]MCG2761181.1 ABC-2 transporter permease [Candidatus Delongbacteria bacterium]